MAELQSENPFLSSLLAQLARTLSSDAPEEWSAIFADADPARSESASLQASLGFTGSVEGRATLCVDPKEFLPALGKVESDSEDADAARSDLTAWIERTAAASSAESDVPWRAQAGADAVAADGATGLAVAFQSSAGQRFQMTLLLDAELLGSADLDAALQGTATTDRQPEPVNLDLVLDVELNVVLRFGQRQLTLREVLELSTGSVVELDRQVEEPVELVLEGKVIAVGEAVVIDGNYGLRVTDVPQPVSRQMLPRL